jgi:predicted DNA-binding transcriptional regulator YafY
MNEIKWEQQLRFRFIEIIAMWEGRLTTNHLCTAFRIGRQQASRDINKYLALTEREQLVLDRTIKGYKPANDFVPYYSRGTANEYLMLLHQQYDTENTFEFFSWGNAQSTIINVPERLISPQVVRTIVAAARANLRVDVDYISLSTPKVRGRIIAPHSVVFDGLRWHVRAYCEEKKDYRDFVLSRFRSEPELMDKSSNTRNQDTDWNVMVNIQVSPNPYLSEAQQHIVADDYAMKKNILSITTRKALVRYYLKQMHICNDTSVLRSKPEEYQLTADIIENI